MITLAIHTYERALALRATLESHGISVELTDVLHDSPEFTSGVRVRIPEDQLPLALRIIEGDEASPAPGNYILVPVDFSEHSYKAVGVAAGLAARLSTPIKLLYSYIDPYIAGNLQFSDNLSYDIGESGARKAMVDNARLMMRNFLERVNRGISEGFIAKVKIKTDVVEGVPEDSIIELAHAERPSLIVMGTRGSEQKSRELIGSVTGEVLDEGRFAVLTVPDPCDASRLRSPENIMFLGDLDQNDIIALDTLYRLYPDIHATVLLSYMSRRRGLSEGAVREGLKRLKTYCDNNFSRFIFETATLRKPEEDTFENLAKAHGCTLLVVPNRHRNAFSRLFRPGIANRILFHTDLPMLVIPK
ncbi:MAG: universal stress protein [Muribaculaceae bacterium]|nr:universal stress protein [Muribaculaceae bacterium]